MEHQPFETWIFEDRPLDARQTQALQAHLFSCADCRKLQAGWQAARGQMQSSPQAAPQPGFGQRFQSGLAERKTRQQFQVRRTLLAFGSGAVLLALAITAHLLFNTSPASILAALLGTGLTLLTTLHALQGIIQTWINILPTSLALAVWIPLSVGFVILVAGWAFSLWRVTTQGVNNQ